MPVEEVSEIAQKMRHVADHLEDFGTLYDYIYPASAKWSAKELRHEADVLEKV